MDFCLIYFSLSRLEPERIAVHLDAASLQGGRFAPGRDLGHLCGCQSEVVFIWVSNLFWTRGLVFRAVWQRTNDDFIHRRSARRVPTAVNLIDHLSTAVVNTADKHPDHTPDYAASAAKRERAAVARPNARKPRAYLKALRQEVALGRRDDKEPSAHAGGRAPRT
ncbi:hypothetical protein EYF80_061511 [Liparis tanakae]|uniref:Uncharacterized protein n=1 Tax=Liparis tanakae TaxID=230148 RepID=A0A4Z2EI98_9TELE|nr:hypothetical protein EYF80_061511 [Liparis tanakae]